MMADAGDHTKCKSPDGVSQCGGFRARPIIRPAQERKAASACLKCDIRGFGLCAALDDVELAEFEAIKSHSRLGPGETLIIEGDEPGFAYHVLSGGLKLFKSLPDGRTVVTELLLPGDFFGLAPQGVSVNSAEALSETELCQWPRRLLPSLFAKYPELESRRLGAMYDEWAAAQDHMLLLGRMTAVERLASFLLALLRRLERGGSTVTYFTLPFHRGEIGDYLGVSMETVSRSFSRLRRDRVITLIRANRVGITDRARLEDIAAGESSRQP